jgi:hypothetical protein
VSKKPRRQFPSQAIKNKKASTEKLIVDEIHGSIAESNYLFATHVRILLAADVNVSGKSTLSLFRRCATRKDDKTWQGDSREICYAIRRNTK